MSSSIPKGANLRRKPHQGKALYCPERYDTYHHTHSRNGRMERLRGPCSTEELTEDVTARVLLHDAQLLPQWDLLH